MTLDVLLALAAPPAPAPVSSQIDSLLTAISQSLRIGRGDAIALVIAVPIAALILLYGLLRLFGVGGAAPLPHLIEPKRALFARKNGFAAPRRRRARWQQELPTFRLWATPEPWRIEFTLVRAEELAEIFLFDFVRRARKGDDEVSTTAVAIHVPGIKLPAFALWASLGDSDPAAIEIDPGFDKGTIVVGPDADAVRTLFSKDVRRAFERGHGYDVEGSGEWILVHRPCVSAPRGSPGGRADARNLTTLLEDAWDYAEILSTASGVRLPAQIRVAQL